MNKITIKSIKAALENFHEPVCRIIVISAPSDRKYERELVSLLRSSNILCWEDEDMLPGQTVDLAREKAYQEADFILILISNAANSYEGDYQAKIKEALRAKKEKMDGAIKEIAVCIEPCELPSSLRGSQPLEIFRENGSERLIMAWETEFTRRKRFKVQAIRKLDSIWS